MNLWTIMAPWVRIYFRGMPSDLLEQLPGVKFKDGAWNVPYNAAALVAERASRVGASIVSAQWKQPKPVVTTWEEVMKKLKETGLVHDWVYEFLTQYQKDAVTYGWSRSGVFFIHPTGCLSGDAELVVNRGGGARRMSIRELVHKFNDGAGTTPSSDVANRGKRWNAKIPTMLQSNIGGVLRLNRLVRAFATGEKEVFLLSAGGKSIKATADHKFLVHQDGQEIWRPLSELTPGMLVAVNTGQRGSSQKKSKSSYVLRGVRHHPYAQVTEHKLSEHKCKKHGYLPGHVVNVYRVPQHRLVAEAKLNGIETELFVLLCQTRPDLVAKVKFLDPAIYAVHHIDGDYTNNAPENLEVLTHEEHNLKHAEEGAKNNILYKVGFVPVDSIDPFGKVETFDLTMESPHNNYVANDFVVHNSGKTLTGILSTFASPKGAALIVTRSASKVQYAREIERFLRVRAYVIRPASQKPPIRVNGESFHQFRGRHKGQGFSPKGLADLWKEHVQLHGVDRPQSLAEYVEACRERGHRPYIVVSWEALSDNLDALKSLYLGVVIFDECFPGHVRIMTSRGAVPIREIEVGELVLSRSSAGVLEWKRVVRKVAVPRKDRPLIVVKHAHGYIPCTPEHKFWTKGRDYAEAAGLGRNGDDYLCVLQQGMHETVGECKSAEVLQCDLHGFGHAGIKEGLEGGDLRVVRREEGCEAAHDVKVLQQDMLGQMAQRATRLMGGHFSCWQESAGDVAGRCDGASFSQSRCACYCSREDADLKPDERSRDTRTREPDSQGARERARSSGRQRPGADSVRVQVNRTDGPYALDCAIGRGDSSAVRSTAAEALQDRSWRSSLEVGDRGGRGVAQLASTSGTRSTEGYRTCYVRVEGVEVYEQTSNGGFGCSSVENSGDAFLYDLEVEDNHNYFADGVLVSNCHRAKNSKRFDTTVLPEMPEDPTAAQAELAKQTTFAKSRGGFIKQNDDGDFILFLPHVSTASSAAELARLAPKRVASSATPVKDRVRDLWGQLDVLEPNAWGSATAWLTRYADRKPGTYGGFDTTGASNLDELKQRLVTLAHILKYQETHRHLPPKRRESVYIAPEDQNAASAGFAKELREAAKFGAGAVLEVRLAETASRKRTAVVSLVQDCMASKQKVTIFTGRKRDCDSLGESLRKEFKGVQVWTAHGGMSTDVRQTTVDDYMAHEGPCILVGTGQSLGEAINLDTTDTAIFVMLPYTPGELTQWEGRFHRASTKKPILIKFVIAEGTVDEHVVDILISKLPSVQKIAEDDALASASDVLAGIDRNMTDEEFAESVLAYLDQA